MIVPGSMIAFAGAWAASLLATGAVAFLSPRIGFTAPFNPIVPQQRTPAALGGGAALFAGLIVGLGVASGWTEPVAPSARFGLALVPALILGLADDFRPFRPLLKLVLQVAASALGMAIAFGGPVADADAAGLFAAGTMLGVVLMNAINFLDVSDGYAAAVSAVSFAGLAWLGDAGAEIAVCGACLGFLFWNWPPARIYLGDAGGHVLGLAGALLIVGQVQHGRGAAWLGLACFGVALCELVLLVAVRLRRGMPFWRPSPDHSALRLQARGLTKQAAALAAAAAQLILVVVAVAASNAPQL